MSQTTQGLPALVRKFVKLGCVVFKVYSIDIQQKEDDNGTIKITKIPKMEKWQSVPYRQMAELRDFDQCQAGGVRTGKDSDVTVLDFDSETALITFTHKYGLGPIDEWCSLYAITRPGHYHCYFQYNEEIKTAVTALGIPNLDSRNDGGCIFFGHYDSYVLYGTEPGKIPEAVLNDLMIEAASQSADVEYNMTVDRAPNYKLRYLVEKFLLETISKADEITLWRMLQRKSSDKYIGPEDVPNGERYLWLNTVGFILAVEPTVPENLGIKVLERIAVKWGYDLSSKITHEKLYNGIIGTLPWSKDISENWVEELTTSAFNEKFKVLNKLALLEVDSGFIIHDIMQDRLLTKSAISESDFKRLSESLLQLKLSQDILRSIPVCRADFLPQSHHRFGYDSGMGIFTYNTYTCTEYIREAEPVKLEDTADNLYFKIMHHLCNYRQEIVEWFQNYLATWVFERTKAQTGIIFIGPQRQGKGIMFESFLTSVFGAPYCSPNLGSRELELPYDDAFIDKLLVVFNEVADTSSDSNHLRNRWKTMVTDRIFAQNRKGGKINTNGRNTANYIACSNMPIPIKLDDSDGRTVVIRTGTDLETRDWFSKEYVANRLSSDIQGMVNHLMWVYSNTPPGDRIRMYNTPIETEAKRLLIKASQGLFVDFEAIVNSQDSDLVDQNISPNMSLSLKKEIIEAYQECAMSGFIPKKFLFTLYEAIMDEKVTTRTIKRYFQSTDIDHKIGKVPAFVSPLLADISDRGIVLNHFGTKYRKRLVENTKKSADKSRV